MTIRTHAWQAHFFPSKPHRSPTESRLADLRLRPVSDRRPRPTAALRASVETAQAIRRAWHLGFPRLLPQRAMRRRPGAPLEERAP
jgi:hypothetical protein